MAPSEGTTTKKGRRELIEASWDDDLAATPLAALLGDPHGRDEDAVQEALDWWLQSLPASGVALAPEISLPSTRLLDVFKRGRVAVFGKGKVMQEEGEEVRQYMILLQGRCRLRCRAPVAKSGAVGRGTKGMASSMGTFKGAAGKADAEDGEEEAEIDVNGDSAGTAGCDIIGKGEAVGLLPGNSHSPYEVLCLERTVVLLLTFEDYSLTLRPHHRELQAQMVKFLADSGVCPQATPFQLQRLAPLLRHRRLRRGAYLMRAGEQQRHVWILRSGSCSLYAPPGEAYTAPEEEDEEEEEESEEDEALEQEDRLKHLREMARGAQNSAAFENAQKAAVLQHARGPLAKKLGKATVATTTGAAAAASSKPGPLHQRQRGAKKGLIATAKISEPGCIIGEEMLLYDNFRDLVTARSCSTVQVDEDCVLFSADVTIMRLLANYVGPNGMAAKLQDKFLRHGSHATNGRKVAKQLGREMRHLERCERAKQERQQLKLPRSTGDDTVVELENMNDWLRVVFNHRKPPLDERNQATLSCLECLDMTAAHHTGPGTEAMVKVFGDQTLLKEYRMDMRSLRRDPTLRRLRDPATMNPMGATVPADATFCETMLPDNLQLALAEAQEEEKPIPLDDMEEDAVGGVFFQTEIDMGAPQPVKVAAPPPVPEPLPTAVQAPSPEVPESRMASAATADAPMSRSSSVPVLPRLQTGGSAGSSQRSFFANAQAQDHPALTESRSQATLGRARGETKARREPKPEVERSKKIMKAFSRAVMGKSMLVLTDKGPVRKSIMRALLPVGGELDICFVKSTNELWKRFSDVKEQYQLLLLDLEKSELQVESLLTTIRGHAKYGKMPIVVLSDQRELPQSVHEKCSFVVFQPLAAATLREALLWCFDRKTLTAAGKYEAPAAAAAPAQAQAKLEDDLSSMAICATRAPFGAPVAIPVGA